VNTVGGIRQDFASSFIITLFLLILTKIIKLWSLNKQLSLNHRNQQDKTQINGG